MTVAERYELGGPLGAGGEARVFRGHDRATGAEVAIRMGERREASWNPAPPAQHPGWVRQLDRGFDVQTGAFSTYELLQGETLGARVGRASLPPDAWLNFARQSLVSVAALHEAGWIHGDLNAENFLLDARTTWKFLALPFHQSAPPATRSPLFGSIYTLAPEQIEGHRPDARSDLYALGCLYYYAACAKYPHAGGSEADIAIGRLRFAPAALDRLAPAFPRELIGWTMSLLERDPAQRPTADAALASLAA